jgi:hypothetical protein
MKRNKVTTRIVAVLVFSAGLLAGILLICASVWGDLEAAMFDTTLMVHRKASLALHCPVLMATTETGTVSASFRNPLDRPVEFKVRTHVSKGFVTLMREIDTELALAPGETKKVAWPVNAEDAAYGHVVLVKTLLFGKYPLPARLGSCGILVLDVPYLSGNQLLAASMGLSVLGLAGGTGLWISAGRPLREERLQGARAMGTLAGVVFIGVIASLLGWWVLGAITLVVIILMIGAMLGLALNRSTTLR